jgi:putative hemolysin
MWLLGRLPQTGDVAYWEDWRLEVVDLDGKRVDKVLACRVVPNVEHADGGPEQATS